MEVSVADLEPNPDLKRARAEGRGVAREVDGLPTLRCPWCGHGRLLRPNNEENSYNEHDSSVLCTSGELCQNAEMIAGDISMAFSGISGAALICRFFASLDAHVKSCSHSHASSMRRTNRWLCAWRVVAEQSPLFAHKSKGSVRCFGDNTVTEDVIEEVEDTASDRAPYSAHGGMDNMLTTSRVLHKFRPVFYFLLCDDCGEMNFIC